MDATASKIVIINRALAHIKQRVIASVNEQSEQARKAQMFYHSARRTALRACDWRFARVQAHMTELGDINTALSNPVWVNGVYTAANLKYHDIIDQFNYTYLYPPKCVRMVKVYNNRHAIFPEPYGERRMPKGREDLFEVMRSHVTNQLALGCNLEHAKCHYTTDMTDESQFDDMFQSALAWCLALELCLPLTADKDLMQIVAGASEKFFEEAKRKNGGESTEVAPRESPYVNARNRGGLGGHSL
jgi:hypothetical protein